MRSKSWAVSHSPPFKYSIEPGTPKRGAKNTFHTTAKRREIFKGVLIFPNNPDSAKKYFILGKIFHLMKLNVACLSKGA